MGFSLFAATEKALSQPDVSVSGGEISIDRERSLEFGNALRNSICIDMDDRQVKCADAFRVAIDSALNDERLGRPEARGPVIADVRPSERAFRASGADNRIDVVWIERESTLEICCASR